MFNKKFALGVIFGLVTSLALLVIYQHNSGYIKFSVKYKLIPIAKELAPISFKNSKKEDITKDSSQAKIENYISAPKPTLRIHAINYDPEYKPEHNRIPLLDSILNEKFNIVFDKENYDLLLTGHLNNEVIDERDHIIRVYYSAEVYGNSPKEHLDICDLVMGFDFIAHPNYIRVPFAYQRDPSKMHSNFDRKMKCDPKSKPYFACFLVSNGRNWSPGLFEGAKKRDRLFHKLSLYKDIVSGGRHLNNIGGIVPYGKTHNFLNDCKFTIAYENTLNYPGYVTEKPFQAWFAGSVPIYNTHRDGMIDINPNSVLYAGDFDSEDAFIEYIKKVDNDDDLYCKIYNQHIIDDPSKNYKALEEKVRKKLEDIFDRKLKSK